jgi:hypothetical protein
LPFGVAQGGESFDLAQDPEGLEGLVEPFRISCFGFPASPDGAAELHFEVPVLPLHNLAFDFLGVQLSLVLLSTLLGDEGAAVNSHLTVRGRDPVSA